MAKLPLPSEEPLKAAEDNLRRLEQVVATGNVPAVEYEKAKSEANRLRAARDNERIESQRNLQALEETYKKLEAQMRNSEIRAPMDGLLSAVSTIDGELVARSTGPASPYGVGERVFPIVKAYVAGVVAVVLTMILRANVVVPSIVATFVVALAFTGSAVGALSAIFNASFVAAKELFNIFLVIALITALLNALKTLRSDVRMVQPFRVVMTNGHSAFFILAAITYVISLFFWPTPAVPLVSAVLLPAAIAAGLSPSNNCWTVAALPRSSTIFAVSNLPG